MKNSTDGSAVSQGSAEVTAVVGGTIIDGNGGKPIDDGVILISGKRVTAIGDRTIPIPPAAERVVATGKFVIPGLIATTYQYLIEGTYPAQVILYEGRYHELAIESAQLFLKGGVTTVFDAWGPRDPLIKARDAINEGRAIGARIYLCGNWIGIGGPFSSDMRLRYKEAVGESLAARTNSLWEANVGNELTGMPLRDVQREVRKYVESGIDYVNYPVNVHQSEGFQYIVFSPRVQRMIVEEAHRVGLPVQALYATTEEGVHLALDAGADIVAPMPHVGRPLFAATAELIAQRKVPIPLSVNTADTMEWLRSRAGKAGSNPIVLQCAEAEELDHRALIRAGAVIMMATYSGAFSVDQYNDWSQTSDPEIFQTFGEGHIRGLNALQQKGMTPMNALMTATKNVATAFKVDKEIGTLERGKLADLVILDRNPLENVQNYRSIYLVMKEGEVVDRDDLPTQRLWAAPSLKKS